MRSTQVGVAVIVVSSWVAGCAAPAATTGTMVGGAEASTGPPATDADDAKPMSCDTLPVETVSDVTPEGTRVEKQVVHSGDGTPILHGTTTHWWASGHKKLELHHDCGLKHGLKQAWHEDGTLWNQGAYRFGKSHGTWTEWYPNGLKSQEFTLNDGAWHGVQTAWYPNGTKRLEMHWVDGQRQGFYSIWDEEGVLRRQVEFVDGEMQPMPVSVVIAE